MCNQMKVMPKGKFGYGNVVKNLEKDRQKHRK